MGARSSIATAVLNSAISFGRSLGCNLTVIDADPKLDVKMEIPDTDTRAWDKSFHDRAGIFKEGYSNPVKIGVEKTPWPAEDDEVSLEVAGDGGVETDVKTPGDERVVFTLIPSWEYMRHQHQHVASELTNPTAQWKMIVYGIIALGAIGFVNAIITLFATGSF